MRNEGIFFITFAGMLTNLFITWNVDPEMFTIPGIDWPVRWYGLLFAMAFVFSQLVMARVYKIEGRTTQQLDQLTLYIIAGTVIGARLGHCLFYAPDYYLSHPIDILKIYEGGLASHGGAIGIITAMILYCRKTGENWLWIFDRIILVVPLSGMFIRLGNLMNSEIVGTPTNVPWGFKFIRSAEDQDIFSMYGIDQVPARHPAQLYEAIYCLFITLFMIWLYKNKRHSVGKGFMFGLFCVVLFSLRFVDEFFKIPQESFEQGMLINMGQILSIPFVLIGLGFILYSRKQTPHPEKKEEITNNDAA